jgi:hypothetical protein
MQFIVTAHPEAFTDVDAAQQFAANLVRDTGETLYVLPVGNRMPGFKVENVGIMVTLEEGEETEQTEQEWQKEFASALAVDMKFGGVPKARAVRLYRDAFHCSLAESLMAIDIAIGELNAGEDI